jgi:tol-pal system protein YbgF
MNYDCELRTQRGSISRRSVRAFLMVAAFAVSGTACMASRSDLDQLRDELNTVRAESASADSLRAIQLVQVLRAVREMSDTLATLGTRINRVRAESEGTLREVRRGIVQMQDAAGQSEQRLQQMKAALEERSRVRVAPASPPAAGDTTRPRADSAVVDSGPGPNQLFQIGRDQLTRGANSSARSAFVDLLTRYPQSELAPDAQFYIAEAYAAEGKAAAADSAYAAVLSNYPTSPRASTALYKRAVAQQRAGRTTTARRLFNDLIRQYPDSDEAELARERLRTMS